MVARGHDSRHWGGTHLRFAPGPLRGREPRGGGTRATRSNRSSPRTSALLLAQ